MLTPTAGHTSSPLYTGYIQFITTQRDSTVIYVVWFLKENAFFDFFAWKNQWIFWNQTWQADYICQIYKLTKFGADRLRNGDSTWLWNIMVLWLSSPAFFSVSSANPLVAILVRIARLLAQTSCSHWYTCLLWVWCLQIHYEGSPVQKTAKFWP